MRKFMMLTLVLALTATLFTGCRRDEPDTADSTGKPSSSSSTAPSSTASTAPSSTASTAPSEKPDGTEDSSGKLRPHMPRMPHF